MIRRHCLPLIMAAALVGAPRAGAEPRAEPDPVAQESLDRVSAIVVNRLEGDRVRTIERIPEPVLRFEEPTRANHDGSIWIWGAAGRPAATLEFYRGDNVGWVFVVSSLSETPLRTERNGVAWWRPEKSDVSFSALADAPTPATTERARLLQMRAIARRFTAHQFWDPNNSRFDLRLLPQPIHRYHDAEEGLVDGALFAFANGTNPEVFLLFEAVREKDHLFWRYGAARTGHAEMHVQLDDNEVWTVPRVEALSRDEAYWLDFERVTP